MMPTGEAAKPSGGNNENPGHDAHFLSGGGEMGALIRAFDWSKTALGEPETWSPALRTMVRILVVNRFPMLLWWGPQYIQIYNDPYRPLPGVKHPRSLGQPARDCWEEIWPILQPLIDTPFKGGLATWIEDFELELHRSDITEETHFTVAYSPVPDGSAPNGIGGVLATVHEITEKVIGERRVRVLRDLGTRAAEAKTAEEACLRAATTLAQSPKDIPFVLLYLTDSEGERAHLAASSGFEQGTGIDPAVIELSEEQSDKTWPIAIVKRTGKMQVVENLSARFPKVPFGPWKDPTRSAVVLPIRSNISRQFSGFLVAGVSSRLRLEEGYKGFLELATAQIATAISNARAFVEQLERAEALAEIDRAKTVFFSNVSHEFRTPLTLMLGPIEALLADSSSLPAEARDPLLSAHRNSLRLLRLVNSLLDFSAIEAGRIKADYAPADLATVTRDIASTFRSIMETAGLEFVVDCSPLSEPVYVDRDMWEKIVLNLLSNAFKFTFKGRVRVQLHESGGQVELTVSDTGTGIPEVELPNIFSRFFRVEGAQGRTYEGTGIGLALIQELVKLHGGSIAVSSSPGAGSVFTVSVPFGTALLPRASTGVPSNSRSTAIRADAFTSEALTWLPDNRQQAYSQNGASSAERRSQAGVSRPRILLADDNSDMREYIRRALGHDYEVETASEGEEALRKIKDNPPDLVIADIMMPRVDGFEVLRAVRADPTTRLLPVIFLSARAGEEDRIVGLQAGANDYLVKPFTIKELKAHVSTHLGIEYFRRESVQREATLRAEAEASRDKAHTVLESITDGFVALDQDWIITFANAEAGRLNGMRPEDMLGRNHWELYPDSIGTTVHTEYLRAATERIPVEFHNYFAPWDRWFHIKAYPAADGGLSVFYEDVTSHHRAEEARDKANQLLAAILDSSPDVIAAKDLDGRYIAMNAAGGRFAGCAAAELIGLTDREIAGPEIADPIMAVDSEVIRTCEVTHAEERYPDPSGGMHFFQAIKAPLREADGAVTGVVIVARDITEQKVAEKAFKESEANQAFLLRLTDALRNPTDPENVITTAAALLGDHLATGSVGYSETDPTGNYVTVIRDWTAATFPSVVGPHLLNDYGPRMIAELRAGRTVRVSDVKTDLLTNGPIQEKAYAAIDTRAFVDVPLIKNGRLASLLFVLNKTPRVWNDTEILLIEEVAARVGFSVEKARAETALRESEGRFRAAIQANSSVMWTNNARGEMEGEQPGWGAFTGQQREEYQGYGWSKAVHPEDAQPTIDAWNDAVAARRTFAFEHRVRRHDDIWRVCSVRASPVFDKNQNIIEWVGVTNDITEERILLTALRESEARYRTLAEQVADGIFVANPQGRYIDSNEAAAAMLGYSRDELLTLTIPDVLAPGEAERLPQEFKRFVGGKIAQSDWRFRRKDGSQFIGDLIGRQLADGRIQAVVRDVTERRQIEDELRRANGDLEQFAYSASHDLQEPLRNVSIYSELLDKRYGSRLDGEAFEFLGHLRNGALRMQTLIHDLLAYTQVTATDIANAEDDSQEAFNVALANLSATILSSQARVTHDPLPSLAAQSLHLQQLFQNLVGNAIKYRRPNEPPQVHVKAERQNGSWLFSVRDNGLGIDPEYRERIFGLFKRLHTGDEYSGTGLGLAICQKIVERYHGNIWVESELGKGSTFYFTLPAMVKA